MVKALIVFFASIIIGLIVLMIWGYGGLLIYLPIEIAAIGAYIVYILSKDDLW